MISRSFFAVVLLASSALAGPPLTTIQDVVYKADGRRFDGTLTISWTSFESMDKSAITPQSTTVAVTNGLLFVQLVPTTTATPAGSYTVKYSSDGHIQFSETWDVPSSITPLRVRDVRIASSRAGAISPDAGVTPIQESDVIGLVSDLGARPAKGPGYASGRVAVVNRAGSLEGATGSPSDCVRVDGSSVPCGSSRAVFVDGESPSGLVDGSNTTFTLADVPNPLSSLAVFRNGTLQKLGLDYNVNGNSIQFVAAATPQPGDALLASYRIQVTETLPAPPSLISPQQIDPAGLTTGQSWLWNGSSYEPASVLESAGSYSDPAWLSISKGKVGLGNVEDTALSTWAGSPSLTRVGTLAEGTVPWARLSNVPASFDPASHAGTHSAAGSDPVTPEAIGAVPSSARNQPNGYVGLEADGTASIPVVTLPTFHAPAGTTFRLQSFDGGNPNDTSQWGYNLSSELYTPQNFAEPQIWWGMESNWPVNANYPGAPTSEMYLRYMPIGRSGPVGGYLEPFFVTVNRSTNKILEMNLRGEAITFSDTTHGPWNAPTFLTLSAAGGAQFSLPITSTSLSLSGPATAHDLSVNPSGEYPRPTYRGSIYVPSSAMDASNSGIEFIYNGSGLGYGFKLYSENATDTWGVARRLNSATWTKGISMSAIDGSLSVTMLACPAGKTAPLSVDENGKIIRGTCN